MKQLFNFRSLFLLLFIFCSFFYGQAINDNNRSIRFKEANDPKQDNSSWLKNRGEGLQSTFVSIDKKYPKSIYPEVIDQKDSETIEGWKGERLSAQILLWSSDLVENIELKWSDFKSAKNELHSHIADANFVRYVLTDEFGHGCDDGVRNADPLDVSLVPDVIDNLMSMNLEANTVRPIWLTVSIPEDAIADEYVATLSIYSNGKLLKDHVLKLKVINQTLPPASDWKIHVDQWQHPSAVARIHNLELWSDAHFNQMKPLMTMLANMGQKVITTTLNKDPWNHQCYDAYEDMIIWIKDSNGLWSYDFSIFDKWVGFMMDLGITGMINSYSMLPWNNELHYVDKSTNKLETIQVDPGTALFDEVWGSFLPIFVEHLRSKGWLEITNIAMDERNPESMDYTLKILKKYASELGVAIADNHKSYKKYPFIRDMCVGAEAPMSTEDIQSRKSQGLISTPYICCAHPFPNVFTFSDSAEATYFSWFVLASGYDGWLRWAFNSWVENPFVDSRFRTWPAGDTYVVYPDARSSIRYERLLEGIQDFEKIQLLRTLFKNKGDTDKLKQLNEIVSQFETLEKTKEWNKNLNRAKKILNELSNVDYF